MSQFIKRIRKKITKTFVIMSGNPNNDPPGRKPDDDVNAGLTEDILYPNKSIDVTVVFNNYLIQNKSRRLVLDDDLSAYMFHCRNPISSIGENKSPFLFNYCSYLWTQVLKTQFHPHKGTTQAFDHIRNTFMEEMLRYTKTHLDLHTIYVHYIQQSGLKSVENKKYDHVPAILWVLTPTIENFTAADENSKILFIKSCLKGLSSETLIKPWKFCTKNYNAIFGCKTEEQVRREKHENEVLLKKPPSHFILFSIYCLFVMEFSNQIISTFLEYFSLYTGFFSKT